MWHSFVSRLKLVAVRRCESVKMPGTTFKNLTAVKMKIKNDFLLKNSTQQLLCESTVPLQKTTLFLFPFNLF